MTLLDAVQRAIRVASAEGREAALVGGLAASARGEPRFTRDADIVVAIESDSDSEALVRAYLRAGYQLRAVLEQSGVGRLSGARLVDPEGVEVDVLTASSGIETEIISESELIEVEPSRRLRVARTGHLIALKLLSVGVGRETDAADLRALARVADESEWELASSAVQLIRERGFERGRDLDGRLMDLRDRGLVRMTEADQ